MSSKMFWKYRHVFSIDRKNQYPNHLAELNKWDSTAGTAKSATDTIIPSVHTVVSTDGSKYQMSLQNEH